MVSKRDRDRAYERTLLLRFSLTGLAVTVAIASVLGYFLQRQLVESALLGAAEVAVTQVTAAVRPDITMADVAQPFSAPLRAELDQVAKRNLESGGIVRIKIWNRAGMVVYSNDPAQIGLHDVGNVGLKQALEGRTVSELSDLSAAGHDSERRWGRLLEMYIPLRASDSDRVVGAYEIYHTTTSLDRHVARIRRTMALGVFGGFVILYLALFGIVWGAANRLVEHSRENERLAKEVTRAYDDAIEGWARALDLKDHETEGHSRRVTELAVEMARECGMSPEEIVDVRRGALLHDIGKMGVPDEILNKPGKLTEEEWVVMRAHADYARELLGGVGYLGNAVDIPVHHHERWDGTGYPDGLAGAEIPHSARLFAVIDVWDALSSDRPYRDAWPMERVAAHLRQGVGSHFDADVVRTFFAVMRRRSIQLGSDAKRESPDIWV